MVDLDVVYGSLTMKDALKQTTFDLIDDMLLCKLCRELDEIMVDLKECLSIEDGASKGKWFTLDKSQVECNEMCPFKVWSIYHPYCPVVTCKGS